MHNQVVRQSDQLLRWLFYLVVTAFEATRAYLVVLLLYAIFPTPPIHWAMLLFIVGAAVVIGNWLRLGMQDAGPRWRLAVAALVVVGWAAKVEVLGGLWPWQGWQRLAEADLAWGYVIVLVGLWCWWRGLGVTDQDHTLVLATFRRSIVTITIGGCLLTLMNGLRQTAPEKQAQLLVAGIALLGLGLAALVLARIVAESDVTMTTNRWRWLRSGLGTVVAILVVGLSCLALFAPAGAMVIRGIILVFVLGFLVVVSPLLWLMGPIGRWLSTHIHPAPPTSQPVQAVPPGLPELWGGQHDVAALVLQVPLYLLILLPLVVLVIAIVLMQRRRRDVEVVGDEAHESLFSWRALGDDLRGLLRRSPAVGLAALLQQLTGRDPVTRVRRAYVQALLAGEQVEQGRQPQQTPAEYQAVLGQALHDRNGAVATLTTTYQRARYAPDLTTEADAQTAETAWHRLASTKENPE